MTAKLFICRRRAHLPVWTILRDGEQVVVTVADRDGNVLDQFIEIDRLDTSDRALRREVEARVLIDYT